jgi:cytochrome c553
MSRPILADRSDDRRGYTGHRAGGNLGLALTGAEGLTVACVTCHGSRLQGTDLVPRISGRSPTYLLRQLLAFQTGARAGATGQPMLPVIARLKMTDMINVVAYAASLEP